MVGLKLNHVGKRGPKTFHDLPVRVRYGAAFVSWKANIFLHFSLLCYVLYFVISNSVMMRSDSNNLTDVELISLFRFWTLVNSGLENGSK